MPATRTSATDAVPAQGPTESADTDVGGFQTFVTGLASKLQVWVFVGHCIVNAALVLPVLPCIAVPAPGTGCFQSSV